MSLRNLKEAPGLVALDRDHPGFRDPVYRQRRDQIARFALGHRPGEPAPHIDYTAGEHAVWATALAHLAPLHARFACREFLELWPALGFDSARIAQLADANRVLAGRTGFCLLPVAGLVQPREFMERLADDVFLATQYIRHHSAPLYTPEPDVIHELVGHAALLAHPRLARVNRLFGLATRRADQAQVEALIRAYWYGLEFGLVREQGALKAVGAGLLSSFGELGRFHEADLRPFDLEEIATTPFDPTRYQEVLFVADGLDGLLGELERWLEPIAAGSPG